MLEKVKLCQQTKKEYFLRKGFAATEATAMRSASENCDHHKNNAPEAAVPVLLAFAYSPGT